MSRFRKVTSRLGDAFRRAGGVTSTQLHAVRNELDAVIREQTARIDWLGQRVDSLEHAREEQAQELMMLKDLAAVEATTRWIRHATLSTNPLVSVVLPTCARPQLLGRAIASVLAASYGNWELVVVEDGEDERSRAVVEEAGDARISWTQIPHGGVSAARNQALRAARGEIVTYLDDDNAMDPDWLYAVVWAFEQRPEVEVLYGAFMIDDMLRVTGKASGALPWTFLHRWDRETLEQRSLADMGAIAHRSGLAEAHFDESLREMADWDLLLRLTAEREPLVLPAVACYYTTDAPDRLTKGPSYEADLARIAAKARATPHQ